jgi:NAD(P)-dependent dehydrogenase (short-subunit alcohol dehydrogenase family)
MSTDLTGTVALITGATSGIGKATAFALAGRGAHVLVGGRNAARARQHEHADLIIAAGGATANGLSIRGCRDWWRGVMGDVRHSCLVPDRGLVLPAPDGFVAAGRVGCGAPQADGHLKKWVRGCGSRRPSTSRSILSL